MTDRTSIRFCSECGRPLVVTTEPDGNDPETGEAQTIVWLTCPRFFRSWRNLWAGGYHTSVARDIPLLGRGYR